MKNHFHLLIQMFPGHHYPDEEIRRRCQAHYGEGFELSDEQVAHYRGKLSSLANYIQRPDGRSSVTVDEKIVDKKRKADFEMSGIRRFRYRTRYFSDSGIIGTKEFVSRNYQRFKHIFRSKHEKKPKPIKGLDGIYSLKRLAET